MLVIRYEEGWPRGANVRRKKLDTFCGSVDKVSPMFSFYWRRKNKNFLKIWNDGLRKFIPTFVLFYIRACDCIAETIHSIGNPWYHFWVTNHSILKFRRAFYNILFGRWTLKDRKKKSKIFFQIALLPHKGFFFCSLFFSPYSERKYNVRVQIIINYRFIVKEINSFT